MGTANSTPLRPDRPLAVHLCFAHGIREYTGGSAILGRRRMMKTPAVLSVLGEDRVGIVATISGTLAEAGANIEDIRQTILSGIFSMTMLVTVDEEATAFDVLQERLAADGEKLGMQITLQREDVFRYMHRI
jgi:ACT domain-containing protein